MTYMVLHSLVESSGVDANFFLRRESCADQNIQ